MHQDGKLLMTHAGIPPLGLATRPCPTRGKLRRCCEVIGG